MSVKYTTIGDVRGCCGHKHRSIEAAKACIEKDHRGCNKQGGYSDRTVYRVSDDGSIERLTEDEVSRLYTTADYV